MQLNFQSSNFQSTVARRIEVQGIGLHTGRTIKLEILPADVGTGIQFKRTDIVSLPVIPAHVNHILATDLNTTIGIGDVRVATIEHLMAAFVGLGIDNALVKLDGAEVPVMDGSALPFVEAILAAGIEEQNEIKKRYVVREAFEFRQADKWICIEPSDVTSYSMYIDFRSKAIGEQRYEMIWSPSSFESILSSRTFCHVNDVNAMRKAGLALGGSLENAVVVSDEEVLNPDGLRSADEFVKHKLLDCVGDLALLGAPLVGKISAYKSGHGLHAGFMKALWQRRSEVLSVVESVGASYSVPPARQAIAAGMKR